MDKATAPGCVYWLIAGENSQKFSTLVPKRGQASCQWLVVRGQLIVPDDSVQMK